MPRQSLLEYFQPDSRPSSEIAVAWRRGYRMERWTYAGCGTAGQFAHELDARGIAKGDRVLLWGENSGEWVAAFLGCMFAGAVAVPMDAIADKSFARRVVRQAGVRLAVVVAFPALAGLGVPVIVLEELSDIVSRPAPMLSSPCIVRTDPVEIVFTSGSTAEPRGVVLTHGNLLANLAPIEKEFARYRRYERIFHPLRFLDLLPLSHVFGQLLGIFIPQIFGATSVFLDTLNPGEVIRAIHSERVSVLITVPRLIESLHDQIERDLEAQRPDGKISAAISQRAESEHFLSAGGASARFAAGSAGNSGQLISGGAALPAAAEQFWGRLGYAAIQGYGLTETTSLVSVNHPFRLGRGSIGKSLPGMEVNLSAEGEILVRGENVAAGYWQESGVASVLDARWLVSHRRSGRARRQRKSLLQRPRKKCDRHVRRSEDLSRGSRSGIAQGAGGARLRRGGHRDGQRDGNAEPCAVLLLREFSAF